MKKFAFLAVLFLLVPTIAGAACPTAEGVPGIYVGWPSATDQIFAGSTNSYTLGPANYSPDYADTFCLHVFDTQGWTIDGPDLDVCFTLDPYTYAGIDVDITAPCTASIGDKDTVYAIEALCDDTLACRIDCSPTDADTMILEVVPAPPALYITQDTLWYVEQGNTSAYIPFSICNGDPCAPPTDYGYNITSLGTVGSAINVSDTTTANGGECTTVYGVINAGSASVGDKDTLTIIAWSVDTPIVYDTCVQAIEVISPVPVPLLTAPVIAVLILALVLAAAVFLRRRARSEA